MVKSNILTYLLIIVARRFIFILPNVSARHTGSDTEYSSHLHGVAIASVDPTT